MTPVKKPALQLELKLNGAHARMQRAVLSISKKVFSATQRLYGGHRNLSITKRDGCQIFTGFHGSSKT